MSSQAATDALAQIQGIRQGERKTVWIVLIVVVVLAAAVFLFVASRKFRKYPGRALTGTVLSSQWLMSQAACAATAAITKGANGYTSHPKLKGGVLNRCVIYKDAALAGTQTGVTSGLKW